LYISDHHLIGIRRIHPDSIVGKFVIGIIITCCIILAAGWFDGQFYFCLRNKLQQG